MIISVKGYVTVQLTGNPLCENQAYSETVDIGIGLVERIEYFIPYFFWYATSGVCDAYFHISAIVCQSAIYSDTAMFREFAGIVEQTFHYSRQTVLIGPDSHSAGQTAVQSHLDSVGFGVAELFHTSAA